MKIISQLASIHYKCDCYKCVLLQILKIIQLLFKCNKMRLNALSTTIFGKKMICLVLHSALRRNSYHNISKKHLVQMALSTDLMNNFSKCILFVTRNSCSILMKKKKNEGCLLFWQNVDEVGCEGNVLLNRLCGAHMYMVPRLSPYLTELKPRMEKLANTIR